MSRITNDFVEKLGITGGDVEEWKPPKEAESTEIIQLLIPLNEVGIL